MADTQLKQLIIKRGHIKARITRFKNFLSTVLKEPSISETITKVRLRLTQLEVCYQEFISIQEQIEILDADRDHIEQHDEEWESFETNYFDMTAAAVNFINSQIVEEKVPKSEHSSTSHNSRNHVSVAIPAMPLPKFHGQYEEYESFKQMFVSAIDSNKELSQVQRLYYLKQSVFNEAEKVIKHVEIVEENYNLAWELLDERFKNTKLVVQGHVASLFDLPKLEKESHIDLRNLYDEINRHLKTLKVLNQPVDQCDFILTHLITSKLDTHTYDLWEEEAPRKVLPTLKQLLSFIDNRCQTLEAIAKKKGNKTIHTTHNHNKDYKQRSIISKQFNTHLIHKSDRTQKPNTTTNMSCPLCSSPHKIFACTRFQQLTPHDRGIEVKRLNLCFNCLGADHRLAEYKSTSTCKVCSHKHNTLLHRETILTNTQHQERALHSSPGPLEVIQLCKESNTTLAREDQANLIAKEILLATASVIIFDVAGNPIPCRALLDQGSQMNFISTSLAQQLRIPRKPTLTSVHGINSAKTLSKFVVQALIKSRKSNYVVSLDFLILPKVTQPLPRLKINTSELKIPENIGLADPQFYLPGKIDILLGAEIFFDLLRPGIQRLDNATSTILKETSLGWIVTGAIPQQSLCASVVTVPSQLMDEKILQRTIERFWITEEPNIQAAYTGEDHQCEKHYKRTYSITPNGRFVVTLPTKPNLQELGDSREIALKRFFQLEKRLSQQPEIQQQYIDFMEEYKNLGHMKLVDPNKTQSFSQPYYFIPHHPVLKPTSTTTKLRVVFNASTPTSSGLSLNDCLMSGPVVQDDLFSIIVRFRRHNFVLATDVEKMYRQILINPQQERLQFIFWRERKDKPLLTYALQTVTYGTTCAPFLATRTIKQLAEENQSSFPLASEAAKTDFYVDDGLTGADSLQNASELQRQLIDLFHSAGFHLRKWASNHPDLLNNVPPKDREVQSNHAFDQESNIIKTLGLLWNPSTDSFQYSFQPQPNHTMCTKRTMLSELFTIFDPLGLIGPIVFTIKVIIQQIWKSKLSWDDPIDPNIQAKWMNLKQSLDRLNDLRIPRQITCRESMKEMQLHGFCDASELGFGACIFLRCEDINGNVSSNLICSKSRIAPLKGQTLPRLELNGAVLLAELLQRIQKALNIDIKGQYYWCYVHTQKDSVKFAPAAQWRRAGL